MKVTMITHDGERYELDADAGSSLMETAVNNMVPGIDADCGGECACGTCHVKVAADWFDRTGAPSDEEVSMLSMTPERTETSRLCCQIKLDDSMDGLVVELPEFQM